MASLSHTVGNTALPRAARAFSNGMNRFFRTLVAAVALTASCHAESFPQISSPKASAPSQSGTVVYRFSIVSPVDGNFDVNIINSTENGRRQLSLKANVPYILQVNGRENQRPTPKPLNFTATGTSQKESNGRKSAENASRNGADKNAASEPGLNGPAETPRWQNPPAKRTPKQMTQAEIDEWKKRPDPYAQTTSGSRSAAPAKGGSKFGEMLEAEFQKRLIGTWVAGPTEDRWNKNGTSRIEFRRDGTGTVTNHTEFKRPYGGPDHWDHSFDFTYTSQGGGVWSATFGPSRTLSGDGAYGLLARASMKKGTFTMIEGRAIRGSRTVEKNHGDYRKQ